MAMNRTNGFGGSATAGFLMRQVVVDQLVPSRGVIICKEISTGHSMEVPVLPLRVRLPKEGEQWILDRQMGTWSFAALVKADDMFALGTGGGTNDLSGYLAKVDNLEGLSDLAAARSNLGLGAAATAEIGSTAGTVAAGDDPRFGQIGTGLKPANNLSDLTSVSTARTNLGLGNAATRYVGSTTGTVAAGDDPRLSDARTPKAHKATHAVGGSDALSPGDIGAAPSTHTHTASQVTDLGNAATRNVGTTAGTVAAGDDARFTALQGGLQASNNLSDLVDAAIARTNLGLGTAATKDTGTGTGNVILGNDARLANARTPLAHTHAETDITGLTADLAAKAGVATQVIAGTGLSGGGDLSANRTLSVSFGTTAGTVAQGNDVRLSDARTPKAHASTHATGGSDPLAASDIGAADRVHTHTVGQVTGLGDAATKDVGTTAGTVAAGDDARFSDARTPTAHTHVEADVIGLSADLAAKASTSTQIVAGAGLTGGGDLSADRTLAVSFGTTAGTAAQGNDVRLSDARTPTAHHATHAFGGSDALTPGDIKAANAVHTHVVGDVAGLGGAATLNVGTTAGTVAAGDDARFTSLGGGLKAANNLSDLADVPTARTNLGLGSAALKDTGTGVANVITGDDARLSDARTPKAHTHATADVTGLDTTLAAKASTSTQVIAGTGLTGGGSLAANRTLAVSYGTTVGTAAQGNDARLSDARTPTAHATTHASGGSDPLAPSDIGAAPTAHTHTASQVTDLGNAATKNVGTTAGTVAAGDDPRFGTGGGGGLQPANNLSDLADIPTARTNLGLGSAATKDTGTGAGNVILGSDSRLSDARTPTAHTHTEADVTGLTADLAAKASTATSILAGTGLTGGGTLAASRTLAVAYGTAAGTAAQGNDARLSDARTPTAHAATHVTGGTDAITPASIGAATASDLSTLNTTVANRKLSDLAPPTAAVSFNSQYLTNLHDPGSNPQDAATKNYVDNGLANRVPTTTSVLAGTGLTGGGNLAASRTLAVAYGTVAGTAAQGNDVRLSDARTPTAHAATHASGGTDPVTPAAIGAAPTAHTHTASQVTDLGGAAKLNVGTTAGTVAAGDDSRFGSAAGALQKANNLSDLADIPTARTNLGLGSAATASTGTGAANVILGNDSRLSDARTPTAHIHAEADVTGLTTDLAAKALKATQIIAGTGLTGGGDLSLNRTLAVAYGTAAGTAAQGNDSRLSDARTPLAHKSTHATGGSDALSYSDIGAASAGHTHTSFGDLSITGTLTATKIVGTDTWHTVGATGQPAFQNSWKNNSPTDEQVGYFLDAMGFVHLRGVVSGGTTGATLGVAFVLPVGCRPGGTQNFSTAAAAGATAQVRISMDGSVAVVFGSASWNSLTGVTFSPA